MTRSFTYLQVEAALCIWEWINECTLDRPRHHDQLRAYRDEHGTAAMREDCIRLADYCVDVYELIPQDVRENRPYDWEVIPAIVGTVDWSVSPPARMQPADAARVEARALENREPRR